MLHMFVQLQNEKVDSICLQQQLSLLLRASVPYIEIWKHYDYEYY